MGLLVFLIGNLIAIPLFTAGFVFNIVRGFVHSNFKAGWQQVNADFLLLSRAFDRYGNVVCGQLFNAILLKKSSKIPFGSIAQTISAVLGHNEATGALTIAGKCVVWILNFLDPNHTKDAAEEDMSNRL